MNPAGLFLRPAFVPDFVDFSPFMSSPIGVTGQRGVLGGVLLEKLRQAGVNVVPYPGDINNEQEIASWSSAYRFSHFFHFAAVVPVISVDGDPLAAYRTNALGAFNVCAKVALAQKGCWLFLASSSHVYEPTLGRTSIGEDAALVPQTFYGVTKLAGERICQPLLQKMQAEYCIGRIFSFTHARQSEQYLVPSLKKQIAQLKNGEVLTVRNPSSVRDIQDADFVIDCVLHLASRRAQGVINIGSGQGMTVKQIARAVARSLDKEIEIKGVDIDAQVCLIADTGKLRNIFLSDRDDM